jgi:hypothetical protein
MPELLIHEQRISTPNGSAAFPVWVHSLLLRTGFIQLLDAFTTTVGSLFPLLSLSAQSSFWPPQPYPASLSGKSEPGNKTDNHAPAGR